MSRLLQIIVTCTKRKLVPISPGMCLRSVEAGTLEELSVRWCQGLTCCDAGPIPGTELYCGDSWSIARSLPDAACQAGFDPKLWICSAGYGLVQGDALMCPYSATLSSDHPDSPVTRRLGTTGETLARWWHLLNSWVGPRAGAPRTLEEIIERQPDCGLLIVASPVYLRAMRDDLLRAVQFVKDPGHVAIISGGEPANSPLAEYLVPCDWRLQPRLGEALMSLNVRLARHLLVNRGGLRLDRASWVRLSEQMLGESDDRRSEERKLEMSA